MWNVYLKCYFRKSMKLKNIKNYNLIRIQIKKYIWNNIQKFENIYLNASIGIWQNISKILIKNLKKKLVSNLKMFLQFYLLGRCFHVKKLKVSSTLKICWVFNVESTLRYVFVSTLKPQRWLNVEKWLINVATWFQPFPNVETTLHAHWAHAYLYIDILNIFNR